MNDFLGILFLVVLVTTPPVLTVLNIINLISKKKRSFIVCFELLTYIIGAFYLAMAIALEFNIADANWSTVIFNNQVYPPIDPARKYQLYIVFALAMLGWAFLRLCPISKQPPLVVAISFSALYAMIIVMVLLFVQIGPLEGIYIVDYLYPFNILLILSNLIKEQIIFRKNNPVKEQLTGLKKVLSYSASLPIAGFVILALFIGVLEIILILFGQTPDEMIKVFTNTADWTFSQHTPPPKEIPPDSHYLCTVAAHGHSKLVKPLRTGKRHGHTILVNRQLLIANAFEDLIKERTPRFHHALRSFYDKTGLPISRYIRTKYRSDFVYIVMKPLEWIFLVVLYLFDAKPENRIAVQYMN